MRKFSSGATRNEDSGLEYAGFLSPLVMQEFATYMHRHRLQADGQIRSSRNWRKGMSVESYEESLMRHAVDAWLILEGFPTKAREDLAAALCGIMFNTGGLLHEFILQRDGLERGRIE